MIRIKCTGVLLCFFLGLGFYGFAMMKHVSSQESLDLHLQDQLEKFEKLDQFKTERKKKKLQRELEIQLKILPGTFYFVGLDDVKKKVALTFDDGPDETYTEQVLEVLKKNKVKATFFLVGQYVKKFPDVAKKIKEQGHEIGNHSYSHPYLPGRFMYGFKKQITNTQSVCKEILEIEPTLFRAPYGRVTEDQAKYLKENGFKIINWSIDTKDWDEKQNSEKEICQKVMANIHDGAIILFHCGRGDKKASSDLSNTVKALTNIIYSLRDIGDYEFCTVSELLGFE